MKPYVMTGFCLHLGTPSISRRNPDDRLVDGGSVTVKFMRVTSKKTSVGGKKNNHRSTISSRGWVAGGINYAQPRLLASTSWTSSTPSRTAIEVRML